MIDKILISIIIGIYFLIVILFLIGKKGFEKKFLIRIVIGIIIISISFFRGIIK